MADNASPANVLQHAAGPTSPAGEHPGNLLAASLLAVAAMALGAAVNVWDGLLCPGAFAWLNVGVVAAGAAVLAMQTRRHTRVWAAAPIALVLAAISVQAILFIFDYPPKLAFAAAAVLVALETWLVLAGVVHAFWHRLPVFILIAAVVFQAMLLFFSAPGTDTNREYPIVAPLGKTGRIFQSIALEELENKRSNLDQIVHRHEAQISEAKRKKESAAKIAAKVQELEKSRAERSEVAATLNATRFQGFFLMLLPLVALAMLKWKWVRGPAIILLAAAHVALGTWVIRTTPNPHIDVWWFQQEAADELLGGKDPYAIDMPNIYGSDAVVYGKGLIDRRSKRLDFGYPYMPATLWMALPSYHWTKDVRYSQLVAIALSALLLAFARPGVLPALAAILLLLTPRTFYIVEMGWTDPFVVLMLSATLFCACRFPRLTPWVLGLFLATKQYLIFIVPLSALLLPRPLDPMKYLLLLMKAALVALILTLPLALWDPNAFWHSAITLQFAQPFRHDALSYLAWAWYAWDRDIPPQLGWLGLALAIPATALCLWRLRRGPAAFALSIALVYFVLFLFSKQAFCNYYLFVIAALCWASALLATHTPEPVSFAPQPAPDPPRPASRSFAV